MIIHRRKRKRVEGAEMILMPIGKNAGILPIETGKGHKVMDQPKNEGTVTVEEERMIGNDIGTELMMKVKLAKINCSVAYDIFDTKSR